jgi:hypothetical protein
MMTNGPFPRKHRSQCKEREANCETGFQCTNKRLLAMEEAIISKNEFLDMQIIHFQSTNKCLLAMEEAIISKNEFLDMRIIHFQLEGCSDKEWPVVMHISQSARKEKGKV